MFNAARNGRWIAIAALAAGYALLAHHTMTTDRAGLGTPVALAPLAVVAFSLAWHSSHRAAMLSAIGAACAILTIEWDTLRHHFGMIYWIEHAGTELLLAIAFGRTLAAGKEPMCTYFARMAHGAMTPELANYSRTVTKAWAIFFVCMSASSTLIFFTAPLAMWSVFANFLTAPLIAAMFIVEYAVRQRSLPDMEHAHILTAVRLFWEKPSSR
jgi:uncharacterized membrane protein